MEILEKQCNDELLIRIAMKQDIENLKFDLGKLKKL